MGPAAASSGLIDPILRLVAALYVLKQRLYEF